MARIADDVINTLKTEVSLLRLAESQGYQPKKQGKDYALRCPFHDGDNEPSLIITPKSNLFHCFGCNAGGSVIDWIIKTQGVSFRHAVELLRNDHLPLVAGSDAPVKKATIPKLAAPVSENADDQAMLRQVIDYYHHTLKQEPEAHAYLAQRGLDHAELINTFTLGRANRTLGLRLPQKNRTAGKDIREQLQRIGVYRDTGREHFNGSLVIPVMDEHGVINEVYGRKVLGAQLRRGTAQHLYLPGPHAGVWNIEALKVSKEIILCEALIDAMTFWVHGFRHVTASYGTSGFTDDHLAAFKHYGTQRVLIAYDRDKSGNKAANALAKKLMAEGIDCFRILLLKGMDVNEYALTMTPADKALGLVVRKAEWLGKGQAPALRTDKAAKGKTPPETASAPATLSPLETPKEQKKSATPSPLAASVPAEDHTPIPKAPQTSEAEVSDNEVLMTFGDRHYRVRGFTAAANPTQLKVNLMVRRDDAFHIDKLDLYSSKQRQVFINQGSRELGVNDDVIKKDLGNVLLTLETLQDQGEQKENRSPTEKLSAEERQQALDLLKAPDLMQQVLNDFERCGVVGEAVNKQVGYLAAVSRKLESPLAVMVQSTSAAGKSALMESVLAFMPEEERIQYSAMTGQALFYMEEKDLKHKILAIAEEEGASNASYALKLLQSEGQVSIASTGKNATTGNLETQEYQVEGPVMLFSTTTAIDLDEELLNRCITLSVDESREQTRAIHAAQRQRRTMAGQRARKDKKKLIQRHQNAQRLLKQLGITNPYADHLTFLDDKTRMRRDHEKYLGLIDAIALLHQYQREIVTDDYDGEHSEYVVVTLDDIELANQLAHEVLGRSLDELPPQTRRLLTLITEQIQTTCERNSIEQSDYRFTRKEVRHACGWTDFQVKKHMQRLEDLEYVLVHSGSRGKSIVYELLYSGEGQTGDLFLMGLVDVNSLRYDEQKKPLNDKKEPPSSPQRAPKEPPSSTGEKAGNTINTGSNEKTAENSQKSTIRKKSNNNDTSYRYGDPSDTASPLAADAATALTDMDC